MEWAGFATALAELPFSIIITTNFDQLFEMALRDAGKQPVVGIYDKSTGTHGEWPAKPTVTELFLYKIHGDIKHPANLGRHGGPPSRPHANACTLDFAEREIYRAWIRTMNNASKGRCVTVTPRGKNRQVTS